MASLPPLSEALSSSGSPESALAQALATLFEPSPMIAERLAPELAAAPPRALATYAALVDVALAAIAASWDVHAKALFVAAHPRIGEAVGLSRLSRQEQGWEREQEQEQEQEQEREQGREQEQERDQEQERKREREQQESAQAGSVATTSPELLDRLALLNLAYEKRYPGLKYITFVNGRPLTAIKEELEAKLKGSYGDGDGAPEQQLTAVSQVKSVQVTGPEWCEELERNIGEMGKIAKSRLQKLGVE